MALPMYSVFIWDQRPRSESGPTQSPTRSLLKPLHALNDALFDDPLDYVKNDGWSVEGRGEWSVPPSRTRSANARWRVC